MPKRDAERIAETLRRFADGSYAHLPIKPGCERVITDAILISAADEIEHLRSERDALRQELDGVLKMIE